MPSLGYPRALSQFPYSNAACPQNADLEILPGSYSFLFTPRGTSHGDIMLGACPGGFY